MPLYSVDRSSSTERLVQLRKELRKAYLMTAACIGFILLIVGARVLLHVLMMLYAP